MRVDFEDLEQPASQPARPPALRVGQLTVAGKPRLRPGAHRRDLPRGSTSRILGLCSERGVHHPDDAAAQIPDEPTDRVSTDQDVVGKTEPHRRERVRRLKATPGVGHAHPRVGGEPGRDSLPGR